MCKVLVIPKVKEGLEPKAWEFMRKIAPKLCVGNNDGLGYAAFDDQSQLFGEKWLKSNYQFSFDEGMWSDGDVFLVDTLGWENIKEEPMYDSYGTVNRTKIRSVILHTRKATCGVNLENVHPFIIKDTALIHNGIVYNHAELADKEVSTCDSEAILQEYLAYNVSSDPEQIHGVINELKAYFACAVLAKDDEGNPYVDIFKSPSADLHCMYVNELETIVFSTDKSDLQDAIRELGWKKNMIFEFGDDVFVRLDITTGKNLATFPITADEEFVKKTDLDKTNPGRKRHGVSNQGHPNVTAPNSPSDEDDPELAAIINHYADDVDWKTMIDDEFDERTAMQRSQIT